MSLIILCFLCSAVVAGAAFFALRSARLALEAEQRAYDAMRAFDSEAVAKSLIERVRRPLSCVDIPLDD